MFGDPHAHIAHTHKLAKALSKSEIYEWLVTLGYFPESYVMPPCFKVSKHPEFGRLFFKVKNGKYKPRTTELSSIQFPKTELTDKTFGIIDPELHSDIAYLIAQNWPKIVARLFQKENKVCSYSFPLPLDARNQGAIGRLRSGRMIYEFIEMAENDLAAMAYNYRFIIKTDIKNFYPSIYTHSISWALHGKKSIRKGANRFDYSFLGNRLDSLFRNANDGCTNGIPIGPVVSDVIAELLLAAVDTIVSSCFTNEALVVRFKDDYRILFKEPDDGRRIIKQLQFALKEYNLELNDAKTEQHTLPDGLFRPWVSMYHAVNPHPRHFYTYKRFKETYLAVVNIDAKCPGTGVIDRFLADIVTKKGRLRVQVNRRTLPRIVSLLLMLGRLRVKAFPKVLGIIELILNSDVGQQQQLFISEHLNQLLQNLVTSEDENRYLIMWIVYFMRANRLASETLADLKLKDATVHSVQTSRNALYKQCKDFNLFTGVRTISRDVNMLGHLDVFKPQ